MITLTRESDTPYRVGTGTALLSDVANGEKLFPEEWITDDGFGVNEEFRHYALPLIQGEVEVPLRDGLPDYVRLQKHFVKKEKT
jgi:6-phosphofructokinase 1